MKVNCQKLDVILARKCLSLADLSPELSKATLQKVRDGKGVRTKTVGKLAKALGVDVTEIIGKED